MGIIGYMLTRTSVQMKMNHYSPLFLSTWDSLGSYTEAGSAPSISSLISPHDFCPNSVHSCNYRFSITLATCWKGQKVCFLSWQLLKTDVTLAGCDWLADKGEWLFMDR